MNINAGTNQYNLSLKKMKEEKRPTFATIFDKLDARSKKLNPKNPLNAVMTNEQMYRYYLEETEPMLREAPDDYDLLDDVIGGKSLKDMKLSEFAKLLSGELESNRNGMTNIGAIIYNSHTGSEEPKIGTIIAANSGRPGGACGNFDGTADKIHPNHRTQEEDIVSNWFMTYAYNKNISEDDRLSLRGVTGFEGAVPNAARTVQGEESITNFCKKIVEAAKKVYLYKSNHEFIISAGGSAYFDIVARELSQFKEPKILLLRSGGYVTHDSKYYEEVYPFKDSNDLFIPAIEVWTQIISAPEKGFGVLNLGKRDVGCDLHNPIPILKYDGKLSKFSGEVEKLNDQHGFLRSNQNFAVSELIGLGISHPCTTFDKWRLIPLVNDNYDVVDCIHTFF